RVEVEDKQGGVGGGRAARQLDVGGDRVVVRQVDEGGGVVDHGMGDGATPMEIDRDAPDPGRERLRHPFLLNGDPADAIGVTVHVQRTVPNLGQHAAGDAEVVIDKVPFGDAVIREEDLVRV